MTDRPGDAGTAGPLPGALAWAATGLSQVYAGVAAWRRRQADRPGRQRWLRRPVISVGNLAVGGTGKTPLVAWIAQQLVAAGERPAILSRGYARERSRDGAVVVRDVNGIRASLAESGDEPLMLATLVPGSAVVVHPDRHLAGVLAESRLGCTVHLLDDGFQHLGLGRDVDLVVVRPRDFADRPLPAGWLRESPEVAFRADAWIVDAADREAIAHTAPTRTPPIFDLVRAIDRPRLHDRRDPEDRVDPASRLLLVSGIAGGDRFEADVRAQGYAIVDHVRFRDHHPYTAADVAAVRARLQAQGGTVVVTTKKDAVRFSALGALPFPLAVTALRVAVTPPEPFMTWLRERLDAARQARGRGWSRA